MNPYWSVDFFQFFPLFFSRLWGLISGTHSMMPDELQIFTLALLGFSTTIVGVFLVLRKSCMQANALSHTTLLGIVIVVIASSFLFPSSNEVGIHFTLTKLLCAGVITALLTTLFTHLLSKKMGLQEDASIGLVFSLFFAIGIILITLFTRNQHIGVEAIMGNVDALHFNDLKLAFYIFLFNLVVTLALYSWYKVAAFDPFFAKSLGISLFSLELILMFQTTFTIMGGFRAVGVILVLAFLTAPIIIGRKLCTRLPALFVVSALLSFTSSLFAVALSRSILFTQKIAVSTSGLNVLFLLMFFIAYGTLALVVNFIGQRKSAREKAFSHTG